MSLDAVGYAKLIAEAGQQDYEIELRGLVDGVGNVTYDKDEISGSWDADDSEIFFNGVPIAISIGATGWDFNRFRMSVDIGGGDYQLMLESEDVPTIEDVSAGDTITISSISCDMRTKQIP